MFSNSFNILYYSFKVLDEEKSLATQPKTLIEERKPYTTSF
jgi:hypothetical protein